MNTCSKCNKESHVLTSGLCPDCWADNKRAKLKNGFNWLCPECNQVNHGDVLQAARQLEATMVQIDCIRIIRRPGGITVYLKDGDQFVWWKDFGDEETHVTPEALGIEIWYEAYPDDDDASGQT